MIIKEKDSKEADIQLLEGLLKQRMPKEKQAMVEKELASLRKGVKGEQDAAYFINFDFGSSQNWAVLHDLRLESEGRVAQIDHLLISRFFEFYVLESKNFSHGVKIGDDGEFLVYYNKAYHGIPSPIEQNRRHIRVLEDCLKANEIMPTRLGIAIRPNFVNYVVMSANSRIIKPKKNIFDSGLVLKVDTLRTTIDKEIDAKQPLSVLGAAAKLSSSKTIKETAQKLASLHRPIEVDYAKKFGITLPQSPIAAQKQQETPAKKCRYYCWTCKKGVTDVVAEYCWNYKQVYDNKVYCKKCQKIVWENRKKE